MCCARKERICNGHNELRVSLASVHQTQWGIGVPSQAELKQAGKAANHSPTVFDAISAKSEICL
jgi:hypothetical protein